MSSLDGTDLKNGKHDSGTKFVSLEVCIPFAPTVNQGDARYTMTIYSHGIVLLCEVHCVIIV